MDITDSLLLIRAVETIVLFVIFLSGAGMMFNLARRQNGLTLSLAFTALATAFYLGVIVLLSFVDILDHPEWRTPTLLAFDIIGAGWTAAALALGYKIFRGGNE